MALGDRIKMQDNEKKADLNNLPAPFGFYRFILKGDHLHFGLWPEDKPYLSMEEAQENMFNLLLSFFPEPPAVILDVGCGLGYSAYLLAQRGFNIIAIAPSCELIEYAKLHYRNDNLELFALGFSDEDRDVFQPEKYDVLFMQESAQYLGPLDKVMKKARLLLKDKGILIIGDEVCYDKSIKSETAVHMSNEFTIALAENGFRIIENRKLGKAVLPTCDFVIDGFTGNAELLTTASDMTGQELPVYLTGWKKQKAWYSNNQMGYEIFVAKKDDFFIKHYKAGDEFTILPMFNSVFNVNRTLEHWHWKFRDNPYGSFKVSEAFSREGALVAHYAGYPVPFYSEGDNPDTFISCQIGDTMTSPAVRNIGLGKTGLLARMANHFYSRFCEGEVPFIYGFNTGHIKKLGIRYLGYQYIDPVTFWVREISKAELQYKALPEGYTIAENFSVNTDWDDFFNSVRSSYRFLVRRDASYLKWRYLDCPDRVHRVFSVSKNGCLIGWSVFKKKENRIVWGDALFDKEYPEAVLYLLSRVATQDFPGAEIIEGWFSPNPDWWAGILSNLGFRITREPDDLTPGFVIFQDNSLQLKLRNYLHYTMGDSDLF